MAGKRTLGAPSSSAKSRLRSSCSSIPCLHSCHGALVDFGANPDESASAWVASTEWLGSTPGSGIVVRSGRRLPQEGVTSGMRPVLGHDYQGHRGVAGGGGGARAEHQGRGGGRAAGQREPAFGGGGTGPGLRVSGAVI